MERSITTYVNSAMKTAAQIKDINESVGIMCDAGVPKRSICIFDVESEPALEAWLMELNGGRKDFPLTFVYLKFVGGVAQLNAMYADGSLQALLAKGPPPENAALPVDFPRLLPDRCIDGAEWILRGMVHGLLNVTSFFSPNGSPDAAAVRETARMYCDNYVRGDLHRKAHEDVDFACVRTNWYWRRQPRVYRFSVNCFYRIDPARDDLIRDVFPYRSVERVFVSHDHYIVVSFKSKEHVDEHIFCSESEGLVNLLLKRASAVNWDIVVERGSGNGRGKRTSK